MNIRCSIMCRTVMHVFLKMFLVRFKINFYFLNVFYTCLNNFAIIITNESNLTVILKNYPSLKNDVTLTNNSQYIELFLFILEIVNKDDMFCCMKIISCSVNSLAQITILSSVWPPLPSACQVLSR